MAKEKEKSSNDSREKSLKKKIDEEVYKKLVLEMSQDKLFSLQIGVLHNGKKVFQESFGKKYKYFDLASMTKAIFLGTYFYHHPEYLNTKVAEVLPWLYKTNIKVKDLLNHSSGLEGYKELYKDLRKLPDDERPHELKNILRDEAQKVKKGKQSVVYSDLGFLVLGLFVEEIEGESLDKVFQEQNSIEGLHYNRGNKAKYKKTLYAPTEKCKWRERVLQGEVFDDNSHVLGGVAPQAGLFGAVDDVLMYGKNLRKLYKKRPAYFKKVNDEWANGFMIPSGGSNTTAGKYFSKQSIGHLGYTGVSFWYDPLKDLFVVVLSNRTYPDRFNSNYNSFRPLIQDLVYEEFIK